MWKIYPQQCFRYVLANNLTEYNILFIMILWLFARLSLHIHYTRMYYFIMHMSNRREENFKVKSTHRSLKYLNRVRRRSRRSSLPRWTFVVRVVQDLKVVNCQRVWRLGGRWQVNVRWQWIIVSLWQDGKLSVSGHQFGYFRRDLVIGTRRVQRQQAYHRPSEIFELYEQKHHINI